MQSVEKWEIRKSRSLLKRYKEQLHSLTPIQREVGVGVMVGDASLQSQGGGKGIDFNSYKEISIENIWITCVKSFPNGF